MSTTLSKEYLVPKSKTHNILHYFSSFNSQKTKNNTLLASAPIAQPQPQHPLPKPPIHQPTHRLRPPPTSPPIEGKQLDCCSELDMVANQYGFGAGFDKGEKGHWLRLLRRLIDDDDAEHFVTEQAKGGSDAGGED
ncbi:MAG: hypothetical protein Q9161_006879 [Pseudevernia consocians]